MDRVYYMSLLHKPLKTQEEVGQKLLKILKAKPAKKHVDILKEFVSNGT